MIVGLDISRIKIDLVSAQDGSFYLEILAQLYGTYQKEIQDRVIPIVEGLMGEDIPENLEPFVTLFALAVLYFVARYAYDLVMKKKGKDSVSTHINGDYNIVINQIGKFTGKSPEEIESAISDNLPPSIRRSLIKSVTNFLNIARRNRGTGIETNGIDKISPEAIGEYPSDVDLADLDDSRNIDVPDALVEIRALDKDRSKTGWWAIIHDDERFPRRLSMDLYPTINAANLAQHDKVRADLIVTGETLANGMFKPKKIHMLEFREVTDDDA